MGRRQFRSASLVYQVLESKSSPQVVQSLAGRRLAILQGQGNLGNHLEFLSGQFLDQFTDPGLFMGMLAAGWASRSVSWGVGRLLGGRSLSAGTLVWGLGFGAEVPAFALTVRGVHQLQGQAQDWSPQALREDLLRTGLTLLFLKSSAALGQFSVNGLIRGATAPSAFTRFSTQAIPQAAIYTGLLGSHALEQQLDLSLSSQHPFLDSLVTLLHFKMAGNLLHVWMPQGPVNTFKDTFRPGFFSFITPEGVRVNPGYPYLSKMEGGGRSGSGYAPEAPINFKPREFLALRTRFSQVEFGFGRPFMEPKETPLWFNQSRSLCLQLRHILNLTRQSLENHPHQAGYDPEIAKTVAELDAMISLMHAPKISTPPPFSDTKVTDFFEAIYKIPNVMVNFINSGEMGRLNVAYSFSVRARGHLQDIFGTHGPTLSKSQIQELVTPRMMLDLQDPASEGPPSPYQWTKDGSRSTKEIPARDHRVFLVGNTEGVRQELFDNQRLLLLHSQLPRVRKTGQLSSASRYQLFPRNEGDPKDQDRRPDYLEAYDWVPLPMLQGAQGELLMDALVSTLRPGGVGFLVHSDPRALLRMEELLTQHQMGDVLEGAIGSPLPVKSHRPDARQSNYLFFRKLPFRTPPPEAPF